MTMILLVRRKSSKRIKSSKIILKEEKMSLKDMIDFQVAKLLRPNKLLETKIIR